jgi:DNA invertase Pin-like site-specific DNA recombinase
MAKPIRREQNAVQAPKPPKTGYIAYYRVSTDKQGASGLGLEAQKEAVARLARNAPIFAEYTEVESGKRHQNRPELLAAVEHCKRSKATLVIAKLDRLARNVHFISGLMESEVDFLASDAPYANRLTVHIMAAFAEHEARAISERTRAALGALKARGVKLGNPRWQECIAKARAARIEQIAQPAPAIVDMIHRMRIERASLRRIAAKLNALGLLTPRNGRWHATSVRAAIGAAELSMAVPKLSAPPDVIARLHEFRSQGLSLRAIAARMNTLGLRTPGGHDWYASTVRKVLLA